MRMPWQKREPKTIAIATTELPPEISEAITKFIYASGTQVLGRSRHQVGDDPMWQEVHNQVHMFGHTLGLTCEQVEADIEAQAKLREP